MARERINVIRGALRMNETVLRSVGGFSFLHAMLTDMSSSSMHRRFYRIMIIFEPLNGCRAQRQITLLPVKKTAPWVYLRQRADRAFCWSRITSRMLLLPPFWNSSASLTKWRRQAHCLVKIHGERIRRRADGCANAGHG